MSNLLRSFGGVAEIGEISAELAREVQHCLWSSGFYTGEIDGVVGEATKRAFADFKEAHHLGALGFIGSSTVKLLLETAIAHPISEQLTNVKRNLNPSAGSKTGRSMELPAGGVVWANQFIVKGVPLTWGEVTKGCTRIPRENHLISNALDLARKFGVVREKFGSAITITSGYRPIEVNRAIGGASRSQHLHFKALDLIPVNGEVNKLWDICKASTFLGLGDARKKGFIHVDTRSYRVIFHY